MSNSTQQADGQSERRRASRTALRLNASIREPARNRTGAKLIDISTHGCLIETVSHVSADRWILLSIAGLETQYCRVIWGCREFAGIEFATPITEPVLKGLVRNHSHPSERGIAELRSMANRAKRLSAEDNDNRATLLSLSRKCAVHAFVEALRLGEAMYR